MLEQFLKNLVGGTHIGEVYEGLSPMVQGLQYKKAMDLVERVRRRTTKMFRGLENLSYGEGLKELGLLGLEKRSLWRDLLVAFQYLKEACKKDGERLYQDL
ncbi:hypothetical protein QYF61_016734 [Mycteria americana]|uniref:Uncharacterized protein n=1 Tax=Mycteria americana TaxID=33587 RepID=A0AAN7NVN4_MYCAM|nr:hypothetical protein QYF61_016734 [Mycteria americana]